MRGNRRRDTQPELALRSILHRRGLRYLVDATVRGSKPHRPDVVFRGARVAVFIDGCFWHGCREHYHAPATNSAYWEAKISSNIDRDRSTDLDLASAGWAVLRVWEHQPAHAAADEVERLVRVRWRAITMGSAETEAGAPRKAVRPRDAEREESFRLIVRELIHAGIYPRHREIVARLGRTKERAPFGLSVAQGRWRVKEVEAAGCDWAASKRAQRLVLRTRDL